MVFCIRNHQYSTDVLRYYVTMTVSRNRMHAPPMGPRPLRQFALACARAVAGANRSGANRRETCDIAYVYSCVQ